MKDYKEYKMATGWKYFILIFSPGLIFLIGWLGSMPFCGDEFKTFPGFILVPVSVVSIGYVILGMVETIKSSLRVYEDRLIKINVFKNEEYKFSDIKGFRTNEHNILIFHKEVDKKAIIVSNYFGKTGELIGFLSSRFSNIDEKEYAEEKIELQNNKAFGQSKKERVYNIKRTKRLTNGINYSSWFFGIWYLIYPYPYELLTIINIVLPIIGLIILSKKSGLIKVFITDNSPYPALTTHLITPWVLMVRANIDFELFNYSNVWLPAIIITAILLCLIRYGARSELTLKGPLEYVIVYSILISFTFIYAISSIISVNCTFHQ